MKDIGKLKNYREKYKRYYDIDFDKEYDIHHIDFNRSNNDISNLLLLPNKLHHQYHINVSCCTDEEHKINALIDDCDLFKIFAIGNLADTLKEIHKWVKWKQYNYDEYLRPYIFADIDKRG